MRCPPPPSWVPPGIAVRVAGLAVHGGLLYVGTGLPAVSGRGAEPALIDPTLPVDLRNPDWKSISPWEQRGYAEMSPQSRGAYLLWLANGRRVNPGMPQSFAVLYYMGIERRIITELLLMPDRGEELRLLWSEIRRVGPVVGSSLVTVGGDAEPYWVKLLRALDLAESDSADGDAPDPRWDPGMAARFRAGLGRLAARGASLPPDWALGWLLSTQAFRSRPLRSRSRKEFTALFHRRYRARYGDGLPLRPRHGDSLVRVPYAPRSWSFDLEQGGLPLWGCFDVYQHADVAEQLIDLGEECRRDLAGFDQYLARNPEGRGTLHARAILPTDLLDATSGPEGELIRWAHGHLNGHQAAIVRTVELAELLGVGKTAARDVVMLAHLLERAGIGVEPDPRLGGKIRPSGAMVLFRTPVVRADTDSKPYRAAIRLLRLSVLVSLAGGPLGAEQHRYLRDHIHSMHGLGDGERARLLARLHWLTTAGFKLKDVHEDADRILKKDRAEVARFLAGLVAAEGSARPGEVAVLTQVYELLGLPATRVRRELDAVPPDAPVVVRQASPRPGYAIPVPPQEAPFEPSARLVPAPPPEPEVRLDPEVVRLKLAETARVDALLETIYAEETTEPPPASAPVMAGLDEAHATLLRDLADVAELSRNRFDEMAGAAGLLPEGALDRLNEAAYELAGEPLLEGDDPIMVNLGVLGEMLT